MNAEKLVPCRVVIGPLLWDLRLIKPDHTAGGEHGWCDTQALTINVIAPANEQNMVITFLHECVHAFFHSYGWEDAMTEEQCALRIASAMAALLQHNPWIKDLI